MVNVRYDLYNEWRGKTEETHSFLRHKKIFEINKLMDDLFIEISLQVVSQVVLEISNEFNGHN